MATLLVIRKYREVRGRAVVKYYLISLITDSVILSLALAFSLQCSYTPTTIVFLY